MYSVHLIDCQEVDLRFWIWLCYWYLYIKYSFNYTISDLYILNSLFSLNSVIFRKLSYFRKERDSSLYSLILRRYLAVSETHINIFPNLIQISIDVFRILSLYLPFLYWMEFFMNLFYFHYPIYKMFFWLRDFFPNVVFE